MRKERASEAINCLQNSYQHLTIQGFINKEPKTLQAVQWVISCAGNFDHNRGRDTELAWKKYKDAGLADENEFQNFMEWVYRLAADLDTYFKSKWGANIQITSHRKYVNDSIIKGFQSKTGKFNYQKLIALMEEINLVYAHGKVYASCMLLRGILDHIPPLLGKNKFNEVVSGYNWGSQRSSRLKALNELSEFRNISDYTLHSQISDKSDVIDMSYLPNKFAINTLLQECLESKSQPTQKQLKEAKKSTPKEVRKLAHYPAVGVNIEGAGGKPYGVTLSFVNDGDKPAILEELQIGNELRVPLNKQGMLPANNEPMRFGTLNLENNEIRTGVLKDPALIIRYRDMSGTKYKTTYKVQTKLRADKLFNIDGLVDLNIEIIDKK